MTGPHGNHNLVSSPTNDHWRLIRKGVMPAFSVGNIKCGPSYELAFVFVFKPAFSTFNLWGWY